MDGPPAAGECTWCLMPGDACPTCVWYVQVECIISKATYCRPTYQMP